MITWENTHWRMKRVKNITKNIHKISCKAKRTIRHGIKVSSFIVCCSIKIKFQKWQPTQELGLMPKQEFDIQSKEYCTTISNTIAQNSQLIEYLFNQTQMHSNILNQLKNQIKALQLQKRNRRKAKKDRTNLQRPFFRDSEQITGTTLINFLYGPNVEFKYYLRQDPAQKLPSPLFRQKNFKFGINLVDENGNIISNKNNIRLCLALYSLQSTPKLVTSTPQGTQLLKGFAQLDLINGTCVFQKLQIKSVTSHFQNGGLFLIVYPKGHNTVQPKSSSFDYKKIRPFVFQRLTVKAKRTKASLQKRKLLNDALVKNSVQNESAY